MRYLSLIIFAGFLVFCVDFATQNTETVVINYQLDWLKFRLNGEWLPETSLRKINQMYRMSAPRYRTGSGYWFIFRLDRDHWPRIGRNRIEVLLARRDPDLIDDVFVRDVELEIKYLMGKNFHRGQDPDLGSAKSSGG